MARIQPARRGLARDIGKAPNSKTPRGISRKSLPTPSRPSPKKISPRGKGSEALHLTSAVRPRKRQSVLPPKPQLPIVKPLPANPAILIRDLVVGALLKLGGEAYLVALGQEEPAIFAGLIGRAMPLQIQGDADAPLAMEVIHTFKSVI